MTQIDVFDPPMCCSTGVCGPAVDPLLAAFAADLQWLGAQGVRVTRHNLAHAPESFVSHSVVQGLLQAEGDACLPLVLVNGAIVGRGAAGLHRPGVEPRRGPGHAPVWCAAPGSRRGAPPRGGPCALDARAPGRARPPAAARRREPCIRGPLNRHD